MADTGACIGLQSSGAGLRDTDSRTTKMRCQKMSKCLLAHQLAIIVFAGTLFISARSKV